MIALTGAGGFLGWHVRAANRATGRVSAPIALGDAFESERAMRAIEGAERAIHIAGVNRGTDTEVSEGNVRLATQFAQLIERAVAPPPVVVFANSTQSLGASVYGEANKRSAETIASACDRRGIRFDDVLLPNLFGEHGRPNYNSVFATFATMLAAGVHPNVEVDRTLTLLHAQNAADVLIGDTALESFDALMHERTVSELLRTMSGIATTYARGEIPDVSASFDRDVFNSYRSYAIESSTPITLTANADLRGSFFEIVKTHGGTGQTSFSTTRPGVTRGQHFHRRKIERFIVVAGRATISLRKLFDDRTLTFEVSGDHPVAVDMPTLWTHNITNTDDSELLTAFWTNELFDPDHPDTIAENV